MKISKLHIDQYRHLENLDFDFTYPEDFHIEQKRGKPLDKICFIGQSATGKTGLLELIYEYGINTLNIEVVNNNSLSGFRNSILKLNGEIEFLFNKHFYSQKKQTVVFKDKTYESIGDGGYVSSLIPLSDKKSIFYFKTDLITQNNISILNQHPLELIEKFRDQKLSLREDFNHTFVFSEEIDEKIWYILLKEILDFRKKFNQVATELIGKGMISDLKKFNKEIQKFQNENPNPLEKFAEKFDTIFSKLNLQVETTNTEFSIPIENITTGEITPIQKTSTGTKGLLLSFLPLYKLETKDSIVLIDEPERSLYPDMQMDLMDHYKNFAPDAQFIVATHSPFIAASFEPEERFILYFNKEGKVAVRRGNSPIGDDPNDILYKDFGIDYINKYGKKVYNEYLEKKRQLLFEENEQIKQKLQNEIESIGDKYNF